MMCNSNITSPVAACMQGYPVQLLPSSASAATATAAAAGAAAVTHLCAMAGLQLSQRQTFSLAPSMS